MFHTSRSFLSVGDDLFEVKRVFDEHRVNDTEGVKEWLGVDRIFRKDGKLFYCSMIQEAEVLEYQNLKDTSSNN